MHTVYKYAIPIDDHFTINLPQGAQLLSVQAQHDTPCIWALVDPSAPIEARSFRLAGTGHPIHDNELEGTFKHVGSFQMRGGTLVFHLFEVTHAAGTARH